MDKAKLLGVLLVGVTAGSAPSLLSSDNASLQFSNVSISARGLPDGGAMYQISACADVYRGGKLTRERSCATRFSPDAGEFSSAIGNALHMSRDKYETELAKPK
jgi:hypothetical protein